jgi:hypothetical protein
MDERAQMKRKRQHENDQTSIPNNEASIYIDGIAKQTMGQVVRTPRGITLHVDAQGSVQPHNLLGFQITEKRACRPARKEHEKDKVGREIAVSSDGSHHTTTQSNLETKQFRRPVNSRAGLDDSTIVGCGLGLVTPDIRTAPEPYNADSPLVGPGQLLVASGCSNQASPNAVASIGMVALDAPGHRHLKVPVNDALKDRLAAKIQALRVARKADGTHGRPVRTREELIEARRSKQAQRKAHKQELRQQAKMAEERKRDDTLLSNSPSVASPSVDPGDRDSCFAFGRVAFTDGSQLSHGLDYVLNREGAKKKGPSDPKTALLKLQNQKRRLAELDEKKRHDIEGKELWLTARQRAEGRKVRNDETLLKRAVKRKEQAKKKSKREWDDRTRSVELSIKERQHKRENNLKKRKDEKMVKRSGQKSKKASVVSRATKGKHRPGFEGSSTFASKK